MLQTYFLCRQQIVFAELKQWGLILQGAESHKRQRGLRTLRGLALCAAQSQQKEGSNG